MEVSLFVLERVDARADERGFDAGLDRADLQLDAVLDIGDLLAQPLVLLGVLSGD
jgi:hypothetical protein